MTTQGVRTPQLGYNADSVRQKFTGKERDIETGLDYFGARYFASTQGRFTTPDPLLSSGRSLQPQSWNRYSYVINRPLSLVDPKGLDWGVSEWDDKKGHHTNYRWFSGKIGKGYTAVNFGKSGSLDVPTNNGQIVRISNRGFIRQVIYTGPGGDGPSNGQGSPLNASAGLVDGAIPFGKQIREAAFGKMGVDTSAPEYEKAAIISAGVVIGAQLLSGSGEAKLAEEGMVLYHGSDAASVESMLANGINQAAAAERGGGDIFWATSKLEDARWFAEANPAGGSPAILRIDIAHPAVQEMIRAGSLEVKGSVHMFSGSAWGKLNELGNLSRVP